MTELQDWKPRDWKTRQPIGYGKPVNPKQPTHFQTLIWEGWLPLIS